MLNLQTMMSLSTSTATANTSTSGTDKSAANATTASALLMANGQNLTFAQMLGQVMIVPTTKTEGEGSVSEELAAMLAQLTELLQQDEMDSQVLWSDWLGLAEQWVASLQNLVTTQDDGTRVRLGSAVQEQMQRLAMTLQEKLPTLVKELEQAPESVRQRLLQLVEHLQVAVQVKPQQQAAQIELSAASNLAGRSNDSNIDALLDAEMKRMASGSGSSEANSQDNKLAGFTESAAGRQTVAHSPESLIVRLSQMLQTIGTNPDMASKAEDGQVTLRGGVQLPGNQTASGLYAQWLSASQASSEQVEVQPTNGGSQVSDPLFTLQSTSGVSAAAAQVSFGNQPTATNGEQAPAIQIPVKQFADEMNRLIVSRWQLQSSDGITELKIKLFPEHLGQVDVQLRLQNGQLVAQFITDRVIGKEMIEGQLSYLRSSLQSQGIQVERIEVTQQSSSSGAWSDQHSSSRHSQQQYSQNHQGSRSGYAEAEDALVFHEASDAPQQVLRANGGFDATA